MCVGINLFFVPSMCVDYDSSFPGTIGQSIDAKDAVQCLARYWMARAPLRLGSRLAGGGAGGGVLSRVAGCLWCLWWLLLHSNHWLCKCDPPTPTVTSVTRVCSCSRGISSVRVTCCLILSSCETPCRPCCCSKPGAPPDRPLSTLLTLSISE